MEETVLYIVVPCYNEEAVLPETAKRLYVKLMGLIKSKTISDRSRLLFVDDGSTDRTWDLISAYHSKDIHFSGISLSRNRGHQNALLAGLMTAKKYCDAAISMDADLQDDIDAVDDMLEKYREEGCEIVYGVRNARESDTPFKRTTAHLFYNMMTRFGVETVKDHADYRLLGKRALESLTEYNEKNLFLRGIVPQLGYKADIVYYRRGERLAGESKYPLRKMVAFAVDGITSFTTKPIESIFTLGAVLFAISFIGFLIALIRLLTGKGTMLGLIFASVWLAAALQLIAIGVIGEYIGKAYMESKGRPRYFIEKTLLDGESTAGVKAK